MSESGYGYDPQFDADRTQGYDDRWHGAQYRPDASDGWKAGWREADYELSGNEDAERMACGVGKDKQGLASVRRSVEQ